MKRWRGFKNLVGDAVEHGSRAVERVQKESARLPFELLEKITPIAVPVRGVREIYETSVSGVHGMIRLVNRVIGDTLDTVIDVVDKPDPAGSGAADPGSAATASANGKLDATTGVDANGKLNATTAAVSSSADAAAPAPVSRSSSPAARAAAKARG